MVVTRLKRRNKIPNRRNPVEESATPGFLVIEMAWPQENGKRKT